MHKFFEVILFFVILTIIVCAHKASPISKDRLLPRLQEVFALNNRQIQFTFSEKIDTLNLQPENFIIVSGADTLKIITLYSSLSTSEIIGITEQQSDVVYEVTGFIFDESENKGTFEKSFTGTSEQDTIAPWLVDYSEGYNMTVFLITFSEAMDTTSIDFRVIPKRDFVPLWLNYRTCQFVPKTGFDSLHYDTTYYLFIEKSAYDISSNPVDIFITKITPDTIYDPLILRGAVLVNDTLVKTGLAAISREITLGIAKIEDGEFVFEVRDSLPYMVDVVAGRYSGSAEISVSKKDSIILKLEERSIDSIIN